MIETLDTRTGQRETVLQVSYWGNSDTGYYYRDLRCPVDPGALKESTNSANVDVIVDPNIPGCFNQGEQVTFEPYSSTPYPFTAPVLVQAQMLDPSQQYTGVSVVTQQDHDAGTTVREQCRLVGGYGLRAGEMRIGEVGISIVVGEFAGPDAGGGYGSYRCGNAQKVETE